MPRRPGGEAEIRARLAASPGLSDAEAHTLAGLLDAEGHFAVAPNNSGTGWRCECSMNLRDDDQEILVSYRDKLGLGAPPAGRREKWLAASDPLEDWEQARVSGPYGASGCASAPRPQMAGV